MRPPFPLKAPDAWPRVASEVADRVYGKLARPLWELVAIVSDAYNRERDTLLGVSTTSTDGLQARLRFYLPRDAAKVLSPLGELARAGRLPTRRWRVLDLGAGLGSTTIGAARVAHLLGVPGLDVLAIDQDARALDGFAALAKEHEALEVAPIRLQARALDAASLELDRQGPFDLVLAGLMLNEMPLDARLRLLSRVRPALAQDGAFVILEPALREITRDLHRLRDAIDAGDAEDWNVFAPCLRRGPCPMLLTERDWCHEDEPFVLPASLVKVARDASLRYERLTYAYLTLRRDGRTLREHVGQDTRRVVSMPLVSKGKRELFVCDDTGRTLLRRLDRDASDANAAFGDSHRGDVLRVSSAQTRVRENDEVVRVGEGTDERQ